MQSGIGKCFIVHLHLYPARQNSLWMGGLITFRLTSNMDGCNSRDPKSVTTASQTAVSDWLDVKVDKKRKTVPKASFASLHPVYRTIN